MHFMVNTHINLYVAKNYDDPLDLIIAGTPHPEQLQAIHHGAHFLTIDKIISEFEADDMVGKNGKD